MSVLSKSRMKQISAIMLESNILAKQFANELLGNRKYQEFRQALRDNHEGLEGEYDQLIRRIPEKQIQLMLNIENIRDEVANAFLLKQRQIANKVAVTAEGFTSDELIGEAWTAMLKAIYGYTDGTTTFVAYATKVVYRELKRYTLCHRNGGLNSKSGKYLEVLQKYISVEHTLSQELSRKPNYSELCEAMGEDAKHLLALTASFRSADDSNENCPGESLIIEAQNKNLLHDEKLLRAQGVLVSSEDVHFLFSVANLTDDYQSLLWDRANDIPLAEIARQRNMTLSKVKSRLQSARRTLRHLATT